MRHGKLHIIKRLPWFQLILCILILIISFGIKDVPDQPTYTYENQQILTHSWHTVYQAVIAALLLAAGITTSLCLAVWIIRRIKTGERILRPVSAAVFSFLLCSGILLFSDVLVAGLWTKQDYAPAYYAFSDGIHTIVIEETSFLLYGGGTVYQINEDQEAVVLHTFRTDDGGRNNGQYEISWQDDYAEITYHTFSAKDSRHTDRITFTSPGTVQEPAAE